MKARIALGTQGWSYRDWTGPIYAPGSRPSSFLAQYAAEFGSVEIDSTFYAVPAPAQLMRWAAAVPSGFTFALKLSREITHERRLVGAGAAVAQFFAAAAVLADRLEAVLVQMPPDFSPAEWDALAAFVPALPRGFRIALEVRDPRWFAPPMGDRFAALLAEHGVALAVSDGTFVDLDIMLAAFARSRASFAYVRWLGRRDAVTRFDRVVIDRSVQLDRWAAALRIAAGRLERICGYANNHYMGHAPATIRAISEALGITRVRAQPRITQTELFSMHDS